jgi:endonuclease/exonuclease/phosphatase (EEP) superfamily protein YafD
MNQCGLKDAPAARALHPGRRRGRLVVAVCSWAYLVAVLCLWAVLYDADVWWPATMLMYSPRWLLGLPLVVLVPAAALLRRWALIPLLLSLPLLLGPVMGYCIPWPSLLDKPPEGPTFRVLTCNMHYRHEDSFALDRVLAETRPDIVAIQEWFEPNRSEVLAGQGWHLYRTYRGCVASRYPITSAAEIGPNSNGPMGAVLRCELDTGVTGAGKVTVFSVHLASPRNGIKRTILGSEMGPEDIQGLSDLRRAQSSNISREVARSADPLLLAGDFNTPPESALYREFWGGYHDAFASAGWGWGYTFFGGRTAVRIDHILAGPGWRCRRCWVGPDAGSPHRPVIADMTWVGRRSH